MSKSWYEASLFTSHGLFDRFQDDYQVISEHFYKYQEYFSKIYGSTGPLIVIVIIHFRATEDKMEYADCLCGQKKNFAQVKI